MKTVDAGYSWALDIPLVINILNMSQQSVEGIPKYLRAVKVSKMNVNLMRWIGGINFQLRSRAFPLVDATGFLEFEYAVVCAIAILLSTKNVEISHAQVRTNF